MTPRRRSDSLDFSRRQTIAGLGALAASPAFGSTDKLPILHDIVADHVRRLKAGRPIRLRLLLPNGSRGNVAPVLSAFEAATGIAVDITETPVDAINVELTLDTLSNTSNYDVALPATFGIPDLVDAGAIAPLSEYARRYEPAGFREDILFDVGDSFDGETYGFQTDGDTYVMFYHRDMLENPDEGARYADQYGVALDVPQTWQELDRQMAYFHRPDEGRFGGLLFRTPGYLAWEWWVRFHAKGTWPLSETLEPQIACDAGVEALEDLIRATQSQSPDVSRLGLFENWALYARGNTYCNIGWGGSQKHFNSTGSNMRGRIVYGPTPGGIIDGGLLLTPYFNWGWNYVVSATSPNPEIAYLFALFASSPEMSTRAVRQADGFFDPFRPEHYADEGIKSAYSSEFLTVHRASLEASIPDLYLKGQSEYFHTLGEGLYRALQGEVSPEIALRRVARRWQLVTQSAGYDSQLQRWSRLRQKYPAQIRDRLKDICV